MGKKNLVIKLKQIEFNDNLNVMLEDYLSSVIHMFLNRLFRTENRLNEAVCYYYLKNYYYKIFFKQDLLNNEK